MTLAMVRMLASLRPSSRQASRPTYSTWFSTSSEKKLGRVTRDSVFRTQFKVSS